MERKKLLLFDTNSIIHRAFHALPPLKTKGGEPGGAVYGSLLAFFRIISEIKPQYVAAAFDSPGKTFRHKKYKEYKANRPKAPDELISQIKKTSEIFSRIGITILKKEGLEADDIVGTIASLAPKDVETIIVTGDMDILQLVNEKTKVYTLKRGIKESVLYDIKKVEDKYGGISPEKIADVKALQGDRSDNIPGVEGVGEKTAIKIIKEFGNLENLYFSLEKEALPKESIQGISQRLLVKIKENKENAFLSKELALINKKDFNDFAFSDFLFSFENKKIIDALNELGFVTLAKRFLGKEEQKEKKENNLKLDFS